MCTVYNLWHLVASELECNKMFDCCDKVILLQSSNLAGLKTVDLISDMKIQNEVYKYFDSVGIEDSCDLTLPVVTSNV